MRHKGFLHILTLLIGIFMATHAFATIYYVSTNGNNSTGDGNTTRPWATLSFACSRVNTFGDTIYVTAGAYTDNTRCVLAPGVNIKGDSYSSVTITSSANPYVVASTPVPVINGSNEISGIKFVGSNSNTAIKSTGRSNQNFHHNEFVNFSVAIEAQGKPYIWNGSCTGGEPRQSATYCGNDTTLTVQPAATDWATNVQIHYNVLTNSKLYPNTIKDSFIHHNTIDNSLASRSGVGHTSIFWSGVEFAYNTILMATATDTVIAIEVWEAQSNCLFHDNVIDGWVSLTKNDAGSSTWTPYTLQFYNNDMRSDVLVGSPHMALEINGPGQNVRVAGNIFANTGANKPWSRGIQIGGKNAYGEVTIANNIFYNINGDGIEISSTASPGWPYYADIDNVYIYNNVFDNMSSGAASGILIGNDDSSGDLDGIFVRNNVFKTLNYAVNFSPSTPSTISGNFYDHNLIANDVTGHVRSIGAPFFTIADNFRADPDIVGSGDRWTNYYKPNRANSNLVDRGTNVGLPWAGGGPDLGAYEYSLLAPPSNLRVTSP